MAHFEEKLNEKTIFEGKVINLEVHNVKLENGNNAVREVVVHHGGACVLAFNKKDEIALVRQFRYAAGKELIEIPAGKLEKGENPLHAAERELIEEVGFRAGKIEEFGKIIPTCAYCTETIYIYRAEKLEKAQQNLDPDEFLDVFWLPFAKAVQMVYSGEIEDAKTCYAVLKEAAKRAGNMATLMSII